MPAARTASSLSSRTRRLGGVFRLEELPRFDVLELVDTPIRPANLDGVSLRSRTQSEEQPRIILAQVSPHGVHVIDHLQRSDRDGHAGPYGQALARRELQCWLDSQPVVRV